MKKWVPKIPLVAEEIVQSLSIGVPGTKPGWYIYCILVKDTTGENCYPEGAYKDYSGCPKDLNNYKVIEVPGVFPTGGEFEGFMKQLEELGL